MIKVTLNFDGSCKNTKGGNIVGVGGVAQSELFTYEVCEYYPYLGNSMVSEWIGLIRVLELALDIEQTHGRCYFTIIGDNKPVVNHMKRINKHVSPPFRKFAARAEYLSKQIRYKEYKWVRREFNTYADELSKQAVLKWYGDD